MNIIKSLKDLFDKATCDHIWNVDSCERQEHNHLIQKMTCTKCGKKIETKS